jgi:chromosome segregation ATPase
MLIRSKNQEVEVELLQAKEETSRLRSVHQQVETEREALKEQLSQAEAEKDAMALQIEEATKKQEELQEKLSQKSTEKSELMKAMTQQDDSVKALEEEIRVLNKQLEEANGVTSTLRKKLSDVQDELQVTSAKLLDSEREVHSLQASIAAVQQQTSQLKTSFEAKDNETDVLKQRIYDLQGEKEAVTVQLKESEAKLQEKTAINLQLNDELAGYRSDNENLRSRLAKAESSLAEHDRLSRDHADQLTENLIDANTDKKQLKDKVLSLQEELESAKKALEVTQADANIAQQNVIEVMGDKEAMAKELEKTKEELSLLQKQPHDGSPNSGSPNNGSMYALNMALNQTAQQRDRMKQEKEVLKRDLAEARRREMVLKQSIQQLKEQANESGLREENVALKEQVVDLNRRLKMGGDVYKEKYIECRELSVKLKKLEGSVRQDPSMSEHEEDSDRVPQELSVAKKLMDDLRRENERLRESASTTSEQIRKLGEEKEKEHGKLMELEMERETEMEAMERLKQQNEQLRDKYMELQATVEALNESHPSYVHVSPQSNGEELEDMKQLVAELNDRRQREKELQKEKIDLEEKKELLIKRLEELEIKKTEEMEGLFGDFEAQMAEERKRSRAMTEEFDRKEQEMKQRLEESDLAYAKQMEEIERLQEQLNTQNGSRV